MTIKSVQKVIKIGSSAGVTIPAKDLKLAGLGLGDEVIISVRPAKSVTSKEEVVVLTQQLIKRHKKARDNLSQR